MQTSESYVKLQGKWQCLFLIYQEVHSQLCIRSVHKLISTSNKETENYLSKNKNKSLDW